MNHGMAPATYQDGGVPARLKRIFVLWPKPRLRAEGHHLPLVIVFLAEEGRHKMTTVKFHEMFVLRQKP